MERNRKIYLFIIGAIAIVLSTIGVSYALWTKTVSQKDTNLIQLDCFHIEFAENTGSNITLTNAFPILDSEGEKLEPYHFTVTNKCDSYASYNVRIEVKKRSNLNDEYLKVMLNKNYPKTLTNENYEETNHLLGKDTTKAYIIETGYLDTNEKKEFDLRLWLDESVTTKTENSDGTNVQKSKWDGIITISSSYAEKRKAILANKEIEVVKDGDGLYEVRHEDVSGTVDDLGFSQTEYRYAGVDPNNYVTFNNELWRIIGLVNVKTTSGKVEQRVKIVRRDSIGSYSWDSSSASINSGYGVNEWSQADLKTLLNDYYYNSLDGKTCYNEQNEASISCDFGESAKIKGLNDAANAMIDENIIWNTGANGTSDYLSALASHFYGYERSSNTGKEQCSSGNRCNDGVDRTTEWSKASDSGYHGIGLMYPSDYGYATSGNSASEETNRVGCLAKKMFSWATDCANNDWLKPPSSVTYWTISPNSSSSYADFVFRVIWEGPVSNSDARYPRAVLPVIYLSTFVEIVGGTGLENDAYELSVSTNNLY